MTFDAPFATHCILLLALYQSRERGTRNGSALESRPYSEPIGVERRRWAARNADTSASGSGFAKW
jgi:hypothetical protein